MRVTVITLAALAFMGPLSYQASAQTVQLPTFSFTTVGTTVMVPDGGAAFLGGIDRAATGRNEFGVPGLAFPGFQSRSVGQDEFVQHVGDGHDSRYGRHGRGDSQLAFAEQFGQP